MESRLLYSGIEEGSEILLTIGIPTYKRAKYVEDSINSCINQTNRLGIKYEIVLVNNDPEDKMEELIEKYKNANISFYSNKENYGQVGNINCCVRLARGKYVALLHDDDCLLKNYLDEIAEYVASKERDYNCIITSNYLLETGYNLDLKHKFLNTVFCFRHLYRKKAQTVTPKDCVNAIGNVYGVPTCGMVFLKKALVDFGYFKDERNAAWDYYNFRLFNRRYDMTLLHKFVAVRRMYTGMSNKDKVQKEFYNEKMAMVRENLDNKFVSKFGEARFNKKPRLKYLFAYAITLFYFYSHNLDSTKSMPKALYKKLIGKEIEL